MLNNNDPSVSIWTSYGLQTLADVLRVVGVRFSSSVYRYLALPFLNRRPLLY